MMRLIKLALLSTLIACTPVGATYGSYYTTVTPTQTVVVINGVELTPTQQDEFATLVGERLPPGRYYVTEAGMMGVEGQPARVNLAAVIRARQGQVANSDGRGSAIHNSNGDSHITSDGHGCTILSTPTGSLSSGC